MKVTIKQVAELAGVSFKSVSRVINKEPGVKEELRLKVEKAIKELNYQPNISARRLRGKSSTIGFIYNNPNSNYVISMLHGILAACRKNDFELVVHPVEGNVSEEEIVKEVHALMQRSSLAGLVLTPPISENEAIIKMLDDANIVFSRIISSSTVPTDVERTIYIDDCNAAYRITSHLIENKHRDIFFFNGDREHKSSGERLHGYMKAMQDHGLKVEPQFVLEGKYTFESGMQRGKAVLATEQRPTAIFSCNDEIAAGVMFAARMSGVEVPSELAIFGFEDSPFSRQSWPSLTTAKQPNDNIASHATQILIDAISKRSTDKRSDGLKVSYDHGYLPEMIIRGSSQSNLS